MGSQANVIPTKKATHGWTSQPWRPTVVFMVQGASQMHEHSRESGNPEGSTPGHYDIYLDARLRGHDGYLFRKIKLTGY